MKADLQVAPYSQSGDQIRALQLLKYTLTNWAVDSTLEDLTAPQHDEKEKWDDCLPTRVQQLVPRVQNPSNIEIPQAPRVLVPRPAMPAQPVAHHSRARHKPAPPAPPPIATPDVLEQPVAHCTQSQALTVQPSQAGNRNYPSDLLELWCKPAAQVLEALPVWTNNQENF